MLKKNKKRQETSLKEIVLVEREAPPACPMVKKGKSKIDPKRHVSIMFEVPVDKVYEMDARDICFSEEYAESLNENTTHFMEAIFNMCTYIHTGDKDKEDYVDCDMVRNVKQHCFWIDGHDFVVMYWASGMFCQIDKVERDNYMVKVDGFAN